MNPTQQNLVTVAMVVTAFISFVIFARITEDFRFALGLSISLCGLLCYLIYKHLRRKELSEMRNRPWSWYIVGCHPETGEPPALKDFAAHCLFVPHRDVQIEAEKIRSKLKQAVDGVPVEDRHPVKVYTFAWREGITEQAAVESWYVCEDITEPSYPQRILSTIKPSIQKETHDQYKTDPKAFRKEVMGQKVPDKVTFKEVRPGVFEW